MKECCGKPRDTKFCPDCGRPVCGDPVWQLLSHCRANQVAQEKRVAKLKAGMEAGVKYRRGEEDLATFTRSSARWKEWADALAELLNEKIPTP